MSTDDKTKGKDNGRASVSGLVPLIHVADPERTIEFYRQLGFEVGNKAPRTGRIEWAWLYAPKAADWRRGPNLMLSRAERAIDRDAQRVLFYLYATDLPSLHEQLLREGLKVGEIRYPEYLPRGEFEMQDPDGYCLMIAQSTDDTP